MSHFAHIDDDNRVDRVIVVEPEQIASGEFGDPSRWRQTSYRTWGNQHPEGQPLRKNYAAIGFSYDPVLDAFIPPQPWPSWILNTDTGLWEAPQPRPTQHDFWQWDETGQSWQEDREGYHARFGHYPGEIL